MNWDIAAGNWKQFKSKVKEQWENLAADPQDVLAGKRNTLSGQLQEPYGVGKNNAEEQIKRFEASHRV
ncbi:CsbD family protein [Iodobacter arcticus]|uniref:CsbD family protein n=1 Tax=Iodobacter arcticus TaxID=590593 RepID=A0ABW2QTB5_9NEIS